MKACVPQNSLFKDCVGSIHVRQFDVPSDKVSWNDSDTSEAEDKSLTYTDSFISKSLFVTNDRGCIQFSSHGWPGSMTDQEVLSAKEVSGLQFQYRMQLVHLLIYRVLTMLAASLEKTSILSLVTRWTHLHLLYPKSLIHQGPWRVCSITTLAVLSTKVWIPIWIIGSPFKTQANL